MELNEVKKKTEELYRKGVSRDNVVMVISALPIDGETSEAFEYVDLLYKTASEKPPSHFNLTDVGNGERLVKQYGDILHYCYERQKWLIWNDKFWEWDTGARITALAIMTARNIYHEAANGLDGHNVEVTGVLPVTDDVNVTMQS